MTKQTEAMKLALEALENTTPTGFNMERDKQFFAAITALREALAEQPAPVQQEPGRNHWEDGDVFERIAAIKEQPAQQEPLQPVWDSGPTNKDYEDAMRQKRLDQLTSTPAQRKPLTDDEILEVCDRTGWIIASGVAVDIARAIEAKLKEKNA